jgi:hypothetical protein
MATRKTLHTKTILDTANNMLANSVPELRKEREGIAALLESLLHEAGAYAGFQYLESAGVDHERWHEAWAKHRAIAEIRKANGIVGYNNDQPRWEDYCADDSRRVYLLHRTLARAAVIKERGC